MGERQYKSYGDDVVVKFDDSPEAKDKVFQYLLDNYFFKHEAFCGETIHQCDDPILEAPEALAQLADNIIKFEVEYGND